MDYTADYQPMRREGQTDPSRSGFATEDEAWEYIFTQMCSGCQTERRIALKGEDDEEYKEYTAEDGFTPSKHPAWMQ